VSSRDDPGRSDPADDARSSRDDDTLVGDGIPAESGEATGLEKGAKVGRYVVLDRIGAGGMGVVFAAWDPELDRKVALKLLEPRPTTGSVSSTGARAKLVREAKTLAKLSHPNVLGIFDAGVVDRSDASPRVFLATEFVKGEDLADWLKREQQSDRFRRGRSWKTIVEHFVEAGRGLAAAHRAGIVHRDFKPHNVRIGEDGRIRVLDFGLAREHGGPQGEISSELPGEDQNRTSAVDLQTCATGWGVLAGTPAYMSPEQLSGEAIGPASDQFSFCVALYEALYGIRPFHADNVGTLLHQTTHEDIRDPPSRHGVPRRIARAVRRGLRADPDARYPSMDALLDELRRDPWAKVRATGVVFLALGLIGLLAWAAWLHTRPGLVEVHVATDHGEAAYEVRIGEQRLEAVDGGARGHVPPGLHRVRVTAPNYEPFDGIVEVRRDGVHEIVVALAHESGTLDVVVEPQDATIRVDGVDYGSRLVDFALPTGEHRIAFTREGSYEAERTYRIQAEDRLRDFVYLPDAVAWSAMETGMNLDIRFIGDVTGDGRPELLHRNFNRITVTDPWRARTLWRADLGTNHLELIGLGDVTGDGVLDAVVTVTASEVVRLEVWAGAGNGTSSTATWSVRKPNDGSPVLAARPLVVDVAGAAVVIVGGLWSSSTVTVHDGRDGRRVSARDVGGLVLGLAPWQDDELGPALVAVTPGRIELLSLPDLRVRWSHEGSIHHDPVDLARRHARRSASDPTPWPPVIHHRDHGAVVLVAGQPTPEGDSQLRALAGRTGDLLWSRPIPALARILPRLGPEASTHVLVSAPSTETRVLDASDGRVVFTTTSSGGTWLRWPEATLASLAVRANGALELWNPDTGVRELAIDAPEDSRHPIIADWDGDGEPELLFPDRHQRIRAYDRHGAYEGSIRLSANATWIEAVGDVDGDGFEDLLAEANGPVVLVGPKVRWSRRARDAVRAAPVAADFSGDGRIEVAAFGSFTEIDALHLFDGRTGRVEAVSEPADTIRPPLMVPRNDGGSDLLAQIMRNQSLMLFDGRSARTLQSFAFRTAYGTPGFGDLDGDGRPEIVAIGWNEGPMPVLDSETWQEAWQYDAPAGSWVAPWIGDLDGDGRNEMVIGFHDGSIALYRGQTSAPVWSTRVGHGKHDHAPCAVDLTGDGTMEVIVGRTSAPFDLVVLDAATGRERRRIEGMSNPATRPVIVDLDEDGHIDFFVGPIDGTIRRVDLMGRTRWSFDLPANAWGEQSRAHGPMGLADLDASGRVELVVTTDDGTMLALDAVDGTLRWRFQAGHRFEGGPTIVDVDGDGILEVLLGSSDRRLYCLRTPVASR
jgi:outer membrane protein assembly factor BamB/tRNA A-37 threonylcarbamoyl transferase component Bud32